MRQNTPLPKLSQQPSLQPKLPLHLRSRHPPILQLNRINQRPHIRKPSLRLIPHPAKRLRVLIRQLLQPAPSFQHRQGSILLRRRKDWRSCYLWLSTLLRAGCRRRGIRRARIDDAHLV